MGVQALHPFPLPHASWRCMCHTSLPMHHVSWPRVAFASPPPHRKRTGGVEGPWVGPPEPQQLRLPTGGWWGPPVRGASPRHPPSTCRDSLTPPPCPPPVPHPGWGGAARTCGTSPRRPLLHYTGSAGRQESGEAPHCPERPPPTTAGAKGHPAPGGRLCKGGEATGRFVPAPNGGLHQRHRAQTPVGGWPHHHPPQHHGHGRKGIAPGNGLPQAEGRCRPPGSSWPPISSSLSSPLAVPGPQSPRRVSSWGRTLRTSVTETQVVVSHPADVGSLRPHGTPGHPGHPSRG